MTLTAEPQPNALEAFDQEIQRSSMQGHWKMELPSYMEPRSKLYPMHWRWSQLRDYLLRSGDLISVNDAGRRTIQLINPGLAPRRSTTHTMQMSFQLVLPGEVATAHRHTMNAIRFVLEGGGTFTNVEGESFLMEPGDLILTPGWTFHDHLNESEQPIIWIDGLDVPLVFALDAAFIEEYSQPQQPVKRMVRTAEDDPRGPDGSTWYWKWSATEVRLRELSSNTPAGQDVVLEFNHPDGRPTLPSIACGIQVVRAGEQTTRTRHTSSGIYHVLRGSGTTVVGDTTYQWEKGDSFVVPNWTWHQHVNKGSEEAQFFFMSDWPVLNAFGLHRQEQATA